jgi:membrane associated rhomboid family serine protease
MCMSAGTSPSRRDARFDGFVVVAAMVAIMWISEIVDTIADHRLDSWGIRPHHVDRLIGIVTAPFLHSGFDHLFANTVPFLVLGFAIAFGGVRRVAIVTVIVMAIGGIGTWLIAPSNTVHIGASGVVFGYATFLVFRGVFTGSIGELLLGAAVAALWGSALLSGLIPHDGISWQGHLSGAIGGVAAAGWLSGEGSRRRTANAVPDV